jgi:hypothetical protein
LQIFGAGRESRGRGPETIWEIAIYMPITFLALPFSIS